MSDQSTTLDTNCGSDKDNDYIYDFDNECKRCQHQCEGKILAVLNASRPYSDPQFICPRDEDFYCPVGGGCDLCYDEDCPESTCYDW